MKSDNIEPVRLYRTYADEEWARMEASWTSADPVRPPDTDEEPWRWSCPSCGASLPRAAVPGHVAREDTEAPTGGAVVWMLAAVLLIVLAVVVAAWRMR